MSQKKTEIGKEILRRVRWLYFFFLLAAVAIFGRIIWIQYGPQGDQLRERAMEITFDRRQIAAQRGDILARDGRILSTTIPEYEIRMDFASINLPDSTFRREADSLAICLSQFFGDKSKEAYKNLLIRSWEDKQKNRYVRIGNRKINYEEQKTVSAFPIFRLGKYKGGYIAEHNSKRFMPMGTLARKAIGAVESDTVARDGIESSFNVPLRGMYGNSLMQRISGTFWLPVDDPMNVEPVNGMDVVTTIDVDIQDVAETMLKQQLEAGGAYWGTVIVMEVATGEIHAMCNLTRHGPGNYSEDFNYAIRSRNEPGSTFKLATLMTLIEDGKMSIHDRVDCTSDNYRRAKIGSAWVTDDHKEGIIPLKRVFEVSSNVGFVRSTYNLYQNNPSRFVDYVYDKLRFGHTTGIDLPDEMKPNVKRPGDRGLWDGTTLQKMAYGYAFEVTPLQTLMFYNAVANNGMMMRPMLVREVRSYGETIERFEPVVLDSAICSPATLRDVRECLEGVVDEGTGRIMKNPYYTAAAKTGTAQVVKASGGYGAPGNRDYFSSFVGYFPAENPKYSCIVAIKTKQQAGKVYYGAGLAGPVFRAIADRLFAKSFELHRSDYPATRSIPIVESIKGGSRAEVEKVIAELSLGTLSGNNGHWWSSYGEVLTAPTDDYISYGETENGEIPTASLHENTGTNARPASDAGTGTITATSEEDTQTENDGAGRSGTYRPSDYVTMPSVAGLSLKDALYLLEDLGLNVKFTGKGKVTAQSVAPGTSCRPGSEITLKLEL